jgi:hypothetical protein
MMGLLGDFTKSAYAVFSAKERLDALGARFEQQQKAINVLTERVIRLEVGTDGQGQRSRDDSRDPPV